MNLTYQVNIIAGEIDLFSQHISQVLATHLARWTPFLSLVI